MSDTFPALAITGVTGTVGGLVARELNDSGVPQRLLARRVDRAPRYPDTPVLPFSYADPMATQRALSGVETVFMVSATESPDRREQHRGFVDAARAAGVRHIVYTSFFGAAPDATFTFARDHFDTEEFIKASGMDYTFLRDNFYLDFMPLFVDDEGLIRGPAADGRAAIVSRFDVARTAAAVLRDPGPHAGRTYELTGPEALTMTEVAAAVARWRGDTVRFLDETVDEAYASRAKYEAPQWQRDAWVSTYTAIAAGEMARVSSDVEDVTGVRPETLAQYLLRRPRQE